MTDVSPRYGVLFDVGYTLLDEAVRLDAALQWFSEQLAGSGHEASPEALHAAYRRVCTSPETSEPSLLVQALLARGIPEPQVRDLRRRLQWDAAPLHPFADTAEALRHLHEGGLKLGVLANQPGSARDDLARAGLLGFLDDIWLSDVVGLSKPDPAFFRVALSMWSLPPHRVAYVGDRPDNDVAPARKLGLHTVRVRLGTHADQPATTPGQQPDFTADKLLDAARYLRAWAERGV